MGKIDICSEMRGFVPAVEKTVGDERGLADASRAVEDQRLRDAVSHDVVVEYCF